MTSTTTDQRRALTTEAFESAYEKVVLGNHFFESPDYYRLYKGRYRRTMDMIVDLPLPRPARVLEVGGGQIILLMREMFGDDGVLADVGEEYVDAVTKFGHSYHVCDLLHDDLPEKQSFDLVILAEVIEHMPVPPHLVLRKIKSWLRPGGYLFLTTPNLYRLRNSVRLMLGMPVFCNFYYPPRGQPMGHPIEYSEQQMRWQVEQAGMTVTQSEITQLANIGSTVPTKIARWAISPLLLRRLWRDALVVIAQRREDDTEDGDVHIEVPR